MGCVVFNASAKGRVGTDSRVTHKTGTHANLDVTCSEDDLVWGSYDSTLRYR